jgi:hypothetical protein
MIACNNDDGGIYVGDYWSNDRSRPRLDTDRIGGRDDLEDTIVTRDNGITTVSFTRRFETGDRYDVDIIKGVGKYIYAWSDDATSNDITFHGVNNWRVVYHSHDHTFIVRS